MERTMHTQALQFAMTAHADQVRLGNPHIPYIYHPIDVSEEVIYHSGLPAEEVELAAVIALLHDTVEDTSVTEQQVRERFGDAVANGVAALTKDASVVNDSSVSKVAQLQENLGRLQQMPKYVQVVKLADRISNLKVFPAMWSRQKIAQYLNEAAMIADALGWASEELHARLRSRIADMRRMLSITTTEMKND